MRQVLCILLIVTLSANFCFSGEILYKVSDIPSELKENARSVIRKSSVEINVFGIDKAEIKYFFVITVLNKNGLEDASFIEYYDKFISVSNIKGRIFNENGEQVAKISNDEIYDFSAIAGYSLYEDNRVKYIDPETRQYPFTVEYSYEIGLNGILSLPDWFPMKDYNISVEKSSIRVNIPKSIELRYYEIHLPVTVKTSSDEVSNIYLWEMNCRKAIKYEALSPSPRDYFPLVMLNPTDFELGGYKGNSTSWKNLGEWISALNEGKDVLLPETVSELNQLIKDCKTSREKIAMIYEYMQGRVRYVNLSIGLGGLQPIEASTVHRLGYGDCKALSNYMKAMLKAVGIDSYYCLVNAGRTAPAIISDFPSTQFNHIILCVPDNHDTIWLECTSQHLPCGYLGSFTNDRYALLIDKSNSHLVMTEKIKPEKNLELCRAGIFINEDGNGSACISRQYSGINYDDASGKVLADDNDKKKMISEKIIFPSFQLVDFKYDENRGKEPSITETININFENYLTSINNKYILTLNCTNRINNSFTSSRNRQADIEFRNEFTEIDSLVYQVPGSLKLESIPEPADFSSPFGSYKSEVVTGENNLIYIRTLHINKGVFSAASYSELVDFIDRIVVADDEKCVFVSNN
jgi:transglutaminase-like putative cysteine protease